MKFNLLVAGFVFLSAQSLAQSNTVSTGGDASGLGGSVSYSVGQIDYINYSSASGSVQEGVQQPYKLLIGLPENELDVQVFPNPTHEFVEVNWESNTNDFDLHLYDAAGKLVEESFDHHQNAQMDLRTYAKGTYHLKIKSIDNQEATISIIKQ